MEVSSFLKELGCPYNQLTQGPISERLNTIDDRILLLRHLISELIAARILQKNQPEKRINLKLSESPQASDLRKILQVLGYPQPPANITMHTLFQKITPTIRNLVQKAPDGLVGNPMFNGMLSEKQWDILDKIDHDLNEEYLIRREMLLKRLDCTIQSFQWSDRTKGKDALFEKTYLEKRKGLKVEPEVNLSDLLAARDDLAVIEKTSSALVRKNTKSSINRVIIGEVPDRGGRTSEQQPPPPEMPPWQQRNTGFGGGQTNRGGSNFSRGGGGNNYGESRGGGNNYGESRGGEEMIIQVVVIITREGTTTQEVEVITRAIRLVTNRTDNSFGYSDSSSGYSQSGRVALGWIDFSAGSYGGYSQDYQEPKRAKTYDQFQQNRNTYADQYVQESQHNMQYQSRDRDNRNRTNRWRRLTIIVGVGVIAN
ncbi:hypothetical protein FQR65_LT18295 [Abscondita terminalis]|nr:hypothetical protein FQR65_LT18295 [Abscondita terminalis]